MIDDHSHSLHKLPHRETRWSFNEPPAKMILQDVTFASQSAIERYHLSKFSLDIDPPVPLTAMVLLSLFLLSAIDIKMWIKTIFNLFCEVVVTNSVMTRFELIV